MSDTKVYQIDGNEESTCVLGTTFIEHAKISEQDFAQEKQIKIKKNTNPYSNYFPTFYIKEINGYKHGIIYWTIAFIIIVALMSVAAALSINKADVRSYWLLIIYILPILIFLPMYIVHISRYTSLKQEAETINFKDQKPLSINILKLYKRLKVAYINANWFCSLSYLLSVLAFILLMISVWAIQGMGNVFEYSNWLKNPLSHILQYDSSRPQYFIAFLVLVVIFISSVLIHIGAIANSYLRINRIENYYNSFIVIPEEIEQLKKKTNKRDMIIFLLCALIIGLIIFIVYKKVKASKESKVQLVAMPK